MTVRPFPAYQGSEPYIFASYAHADAGSVYPLLTDLHQRDFNIWYDEGIAPGESWREELAAAIENASRIIFFVSDRSVESHNCKKEVNFGLSCEVPITLVYIEPTDLPRALQFSLGDEQALHADHYSPDHFRDRLANLLSQDPRLEGDAHYPGHWRRRRTRPLGVVMGLVLAVASTWYWLNANQEGPDTKIKSLAVTPIAYHGEGGHMWIGTALTNLVSDQLADSRHTELVSQTRWSNLRKEFSELDLLQDAAKQRGIRYVLTGELIETPANRILSLRISDLVAGVDVGARTFEDIRPERLGLVANEIVKAVSQALNLPIEQQRETLTADFFADNYPAYQAYVAGLEFYNSFAYEEAVSAMETALELDPSFHMARFRLANIQFSQGATAAAQANLERIPDDAKLSQRERLYVDGLTLLVADSNVEAGEVFAQLINEFPYEVEAQQFLAESRWRSFDTEGAIEVLQNLSVREPENHHVLSALSYMLASIQSYERAELAARSYADIAPGLPHPWEMLGNLALHRHDLEQAEIYFQRALDIQGDFLLAVIGSARTLALLGNYADAQKSLHSIVTDEAAVPRYRIIAALDLASLQLASGEYVEVDDTFATVQSLIDAEGGRQALALQQRGLAALYRGQHDVALTLLEEAVQKAPASGVPTRYLFARGLIELATGAVDSLPNTISEIREYSLPAENVDRTEEKAALYLEGKLLAAQGNAQGAISKLNQAVETTGYTYRSANMALAEVHAQRGQNEAAFEALIRAITTRDQFLATDPRLDLELDRQQALRLGLQVACEPGRQSALRQLTMTVREHWPVHPEPAC